MNRRLHRKPLQRRPGRHLRHGDLRQRSIHLGQVQLLETIRAEGKKRRQKKNSGSAKHRPICCPDDLPASSKTLGERGGDAYPLGMLAKLRWGILGTGNIATQFTLGLKKSERGVAAAVGSRAAHSAGAFADKHHIPIPLASYEELVSSPEIDAVYNSLPNSLHAPWTIRALAAGKHVLCEKPLAMDAPEAGRMFEAAKKAGKLLVEAFMYRSHPQTLAVVEAVRSGVIGKLRLIRSSFCYRTRKVQGNVRFVRELGGGGLMDIGCYCINFARFFAAQEPSAIHVTANFHKTGVDELAAGTLVFPSGIVSTFSCGMCLHADNTAQLCGTEGYIEIPVPWKPSPGNAKFTVSGSAPPKMDNPQTFGPPPREVRIIDAPGDMYAMEADEFAVAALDGKAPRISREDSVGNMRVLDEMRKQIGLVF